MTKSDGVPVDEDIQSELQQKIKLEGIRLNTSILACSFQELLWQEQRKASLQSNAKGINWHPLC